MAMATLILTVLVSFSPAFEASQPNTPLSQSDVETADYYCHDGTFLKPPAEE
jgi:hypothetical protein